MKISQYFPTELRQIEYNATTNTKPRERISVVIDEIRKFSTHVEYIDLLQKFSKLSFNK